MTAIPLTVPSVSPARRAKMTFYIRALVAVAMIGAWVVTAGNGLLLWLAPDGPGAGRLSLLFGATKHTWTDIHTAVAFLAVILTLVHLIVMRRGVLAYARLLVTGQRNAAGPSKRRPRVIVLVRAVVVVTMLGVVPVVVASGIVPWLAADGPRSTEQILLFDVTKRGWTDIHTAVAIAAMLLAVTHLVVVRAGLAADVRLLATGQRSKPRRVAR